MRSRCVSHERAEGSAPTPNLCLAPPRAGGVAAPPGEVAYLQSSGAGPPLPEPSDETRAPAPWELLTPSTVSSGRSGRPRRVEPAVPLAQKGPSLALRWPRPPARGPPEIPRRAPRKSHIENPPGATCLMPSAGPDGASGLLPFRSLHASMWPEITCTGASKWARLLPIPSLGRPGKPKQDGRQDETVPFLSPLYVLYSCICFWPAGQAPRRARWQTWA